MDRYTGKNKSGYFIHAFLRVSGECDKLNRAINRLGEYEETGLTPDQIQKMVTDERKIIKKPEVNNYYYFCPNCGCRRSIKQKHNYCHDCGQALEW